MEIITSDDDSPHCETWRLSRVPEANVALIAATAFRKAVLAALLMLIAVAPPPTSSSPSHHCRQVDELLCPSSLPPLSPDGLGLPPPPPPVVPPVLEPLPPPVCGDTWRPLAVAVPLLPQGMLSTTVVVVVLLSTAVAAAAAVLGCCLGELLCSTFSVAPLLLPARTGG